MICTEIVVNKFLNLYLEALTITIANLSVWCVVDYEARILTQIRIHRHV